VEILSSSRIGSVTRVVPLGLRTSQSQRLVVRGGDLSCEGPSSGKLVGDAVVWPRTGPLASEGLDEDLHAFPEMQHQVKGGLLLDVVVSKGMTILELLASKQLSPPQELRFRRCLRRTILPSKGGPNQGPRQSHLAIPPPGLATTLPSSREVRADPLMPHRS
jgi:hypothetical protein